MYVLLCLCVTAIMGEPVYGFDFCVIGLELRLFGTIILNFYSLNIKKKRKRKTSIILILTFRLVKMRPVCLKKLYTTCKQSKGQNH